MPNWTFSRVVTLGKFLRCCFHTFYYRENIIACFYHPEACGYQVRPCMWKYIEKWKCGMLTSLSLLNRKGSIGGGSRESKGFGNRPVFCFGIFFLRLYLFMRDTHRERGRDTGRRRSRLLAGIPMWDSIPGSQDPRISGLRPVPKADAQPLCYPRAPGLCFVATLPLLFVALWPQKSHLTFLGLSFLKCKNGFNKHSSELF